MQAYENGAEIEFKSIRSNCKEWLQATSPTWDWFNCEYRIKVNESFWKPKQGEIVYRIAAINDKDQDIIESECWTQLDIDLGTVYKTKEDAEQAIKVKLAEQRLKKAIYVANGNRQCNFVVGKENWMVDFNSKKLSIGMWINVKTLPNWYYCKNKEVAEQILQEHKDDLITYLNQ